VQLEADEGPQSDGVRGDASEGGRVTLRGHLPRGLLEELEGIEVAPR
jgi:hypothetical protein